MKIILLFLAFWGAMMMTPSYLIAQAARPSFTEKPENRLDAQGRKQGLWLLRSSASKGEPGFIELGQFQDGRRIGPWYKIDGEGELVSMLNYRFGVLDGEAQYYEQGRLVATGHYMGLNPKNETDTFLVEDPVTGEQVWRYIATDRGTVRHGIWKFYDPLSGRLIEEQEYQLDSLIYQRDFPMSSADSLYFKKREQELPHNQHKTPYAPPVEKQIHYGDPGRVD